MLSYTPTHQFLVGIDSDGCVFDSMELKHKECFIPNFINCYELQGVSKYAREAAEFVNLYSKSRGVNRFPGLVEQLDWLRRTVGEIPAKTPVLILSHIPILSASAILWGRDENGNITVSVSLMHGDCIHLKDLFARHPNVKLCLSGHLHLVDRVDYNGVTYLCNGAVSGNWWKGRHKDCDEGYAVLDLYDDGSFDHQYVKYGWQAAV